MIKPLFIPADSSILVRVFSATCSGVLVTALWASAPHAGAQAITIDTRTGNVSTGGSTVDRRYQQIKPTNVDLPKTGLDAKTRLELIRVLQAEQGFAMRPFPRGHKGLTLQANGKLKPAGEPYLDMVTQFGICAKPGDAVVLTDIKFDKNKMVFMINGGPDLKHRFLRHVQLGAGGAMTPMVQGGDENEPMGARLTLEFEGGVPSLTGSQVKALLAPLISFDVKTPIQAFTDTLPPKLKEAILNHDVWVGMSTDMVLFAKGQPIRKVRETEGQTPFEEWIYGQTPQPVEFVRINGNRVIRVEIAKVGEAPQVFDQDVVEGLMRSDGTPAVTVAQEKTRTVQVGDVTRDPDKQAPAPPPTLVNPGEQLPDAARNPAGQMKPVQFPKQKADDYPDVAAARRADQAKAAEAADKDKRGVSGDDAGKPATPGSAPSLGPANPTPAPVPEQKPE
ncbi:hypothetical protein [Occallatibacter savannae]|uniref:hypothetical protein n=1 Tax=Occallatibacter savannae TaxID=1002691 RepID=UPI000D688A2B|nr:hypothetical protein [Occallatibacter savannae]